MQYAYTPAGSYPPYINVTLLDDGTVRVIVRSASTEEGRTGSCGEIIMPRDEFIAVFGPAMIALS